MQKISLPTIPLLSFIEKSARSIADQAGYSHTTINKIIAGLIQDGELKERGNGNLTNITNVPKMP